MISYCGTPTEKVPEFSHNQLQLIMRKCLSYIKELVDFIYKIWRSSFIPDDAILVTSDVTAFYFIITNNSGLNDLREVLDKREQNNNFYSRISSNGRV